MGPLNDVCPHNFFYWNAMDIKPCVNYFSHCLRFSVRWSRDMSREELKRYLSFKKLWTRGYFCVPHFNSISTILFHEVTIKPTAMLPDLRTRYCTS